MCELTGRDTSSVREERVPLVARRTPESNEEKETLNSAHNTIRNTGSTPGMLLIALFTASSCVAGPAGITCRLPVDVQEASIRKPTKGITN